MKIAVTGASGFVGRPLCKELIARGFAVRALVRDAKSFADEPLDGFEIFPVGTIHARTDWADSLTGVDCLIHCAGRVHVMNEAPENALQAYRQTNVEGSRHLAEQAAAAGVRRFVYLSSIKVNGESTQPGHPYTAFDEPRPEDPYGQSKWEAELALREIQDQTGMEVVIIRPPLIYGLGVKGNLARMLRFVKRGLPLPLGLVRNARSLVGIDNLIDLIVTCLQHPAAARQTFLVSDGKDLSTAELLRSIAASTGVPARLWPVPIAALRLVGKLTGRMNEINRLAGSLQVNIAPTQAALNWTPPYSVDECLRRMVSSEVDARV